MEDKRQYKISMTELDAPWIFVKEYPDEMMLFKIDNPDDFVDEEVLNNHQVIAIEHELYNYNEKKL